MKAKTLLGLALLAFAVGSIGYLVASEWGGGGDEDTAAAAPNAPATPGPPADLGAGLPEDGVVVTYFVGGKRCPTCLKIEDYAKEALTEGFPGQVAGGTVVWRIVDTDAAANRYFVEHYDLFAKTLIVSRRAAGEEVNWQSLDDIWTRVADKDDFLAYVRGAVTGYLADMEAEAP